MPVTRKTARELCTETEFRLVNASFSPEVKELSKAELKKHIQRTRNVRDKFKDLGRRQHLEAKGSRKPSGRKPASGNQGTLKKAQLFEETLARFEKRLTAVEAQEEKAARKAAEKTRKAALKKVVKPKSPKTSSSKSIAIQKQGQDNTKLRKGQAIKGVKIGSHVRAANRRSQARRDNRR